MSEISSYNQRIAKNTLWLYIRVFYDDGICLMKEYN